MPFSGLGGGRAQLHSLAFRDRAFGVGAVLRADREGGRIVILVRVLIGVIECYIRLFDRRHDKMHEST